MISHAVKDTLGKKVSLNLLAHPRHLSQNSIDDPDELRSIMLEEEARQLRNSLINEKNRNARLMRVIEQRRLMINSRRSHLLILHV